MLNAFNLLLLSVTAAVLVAAVVLVDNGMSMANALLIVMLAPGERYLIRSARLPPGRRCYDGAFSRLGVG